MIGACVRHPQEMPHAGLLGSALVCMVFGFIHSNAGDVEMAKELALLLKSERLSDEDVRAILSQGNPFGKLIEPKEVSLIFLEGEKKESSSEILLALTWDRPDELPERPPSSGENRPRRLAFRVEDHFLVRWAFEILRELAPHLIRA